jgi:site-specific recombinase XerD
MLIRKHLKPALGHFPLKDLRPEYLQHFYNEKRRQGASARTVRYLHTLLHGALTQAEKNQPIVRNVATLVEPPRKERKEMQTLTLQQVTTRLGRLHISPPTVIKERKKKRLLSSR